MIENENGQQCLNCVSLVQHPDQREFECPTTLPIPRFDSGFIDWSIEDLGAFVKTHMPTYAAGGNLIPDIFLVLDERSTREDTLILARWCEKWSEYAREYDEWTKDQLIFEGWVAHRVKFRQAWTVVAVLDFLVGLDDGWLYGEGYSVSDHDVFSPTWKKENIITKLRHPDDQNSLPGQTRL
ncbi:MAG: hypothetical protein M1828_002795 [Chrysothrix sp. TS-e1954]|nr:MAG: hypothetical protein M1828_002795 [Chrysothrix sp. TS-e1954]